MLSVCLTCLEELLKCLSELTELDVAPVLAAVPLDPYQASDTRSSRADVVGLPHRRLRLSSLVLLVTHFLARPRKGLPACTCC